MCETELGARQLQVEREPTGRSILLASPSPWAGTVWTPYALGHTVSVCGFTHPAYSEQGSGRRCAHLGGQSEDGPALHPSSWGLSLRTLILGPLTGGQYRLCPLHLETGRNSPLS